MNQHFLQTLKPFFTRIAIALAAFMAVLIAFVSISEEVHEGDATRFDVAILEAIHSHTTPAWNAFFTVVTELGSALFLGSVTLALIAWLIWRRRLYSAAFVVAAIGGASAINVLLKLLFQRERPELWQRIVQESSYSFPSGHAMGSSAVTFTIIALLWNTKYRLLSVTVGSLYIGLIGYSRLYLGVHYPTDILAGWLVTFAWVLAVAALVMATFYRRRARYLRNSL